MTTNTIKIDSTHTHTHNVNQPENSLMEIHKINLQMAKRVNIVASYHSHTNGNVIMDTPLELLRSHTYNKCSPSFRQHENVNRTTSTEMYTHQLHCFARKIIPFWLFCCVLFSRHFFCFSVMRSGLDVRINLFIYFVRDIITLCV